MDKPILMGAVLYDPKVSVIWGIIGEFFQENGYPIDTVFYTNYALQVTALLNGHIDIAWNSPLAWLDAQRQSGGTCRAIAMRDTDRDRVTYIITRSQGNTKTVQDLRGETIAVGAQDSPQATLILLGLLQRHGLEPGRDVQVRRFDLMVGKHGDHIGGELEAFKCLASGEADASALIDLHWQTWTQNGTINPQEYAMKSSCCGWRGRIAPGVTIVSKANRATTSVTPTRSSADCIGRQLSPIKVDEGSFVLDRGQVKRACEISWPQIATWIVYALGPEAFMWTRSFVCDC